MVSTGNSSLESANPAFDNALRQALGAGTQLVYSGAAYSGAPVGNLEENAVLRAARVHSARVSAQGEIAAAGAAAGLPANKIAEFIARLENIGTVTGIVAAADALRGEIIALGSETTLERASEGQESQKEMMERINAEHKELYATDAVYRAATDKITAEAHQTMAELDAKQAPMDKLAAKLGITTELDGDVADAREALEQAEKNGDAVAAREAQVKYVQLLAQQNKLREAKARESGHGAEAEQFGGHDTSIKDALAKSKAEYNAQREAYLEAFTRKLSVGGLTAEEKAEIARQREYYNKKEAELSTTSEFIDSAETLKNKTIGINRPTENKNGLVQASDVGGAAVQQVNKPEVVAEVVLTKTTDVPAQVGEVAKTTVAATNGDDKAAAAQNPGKLQVAEASRAEAKLPAFTPAGKFVPQVSSAVLG